MENLGNKLTEISQRELDVATSRGVLAIQQTQRNGIKAELVQAFYKDLKAFADKYGFEAYITKEGPILEILNPSVEDKVERMDEEDICTGMIAIEFDLKIKNLDFDGSLNEVEYLEELEQERIEEEKKAAEKKAKIEKDASIRAEKARIREAKLKTYLDNEKDE